MPETCMTISGIVSPQMSRHRPVPISLEVGEMGSIFQSDIMGVHDYPCAA